MKILVKVNTLRVQCQNTKCILIDEISMVGTKPFRYANLRLQEIFQNTEPCGGLYDICFDDVYGLSHVKDCWIFENLKYGISTLTLNEWKCLFQVYEFTEVMPQREDSEFIQYMDAYSYMDKI